MHKFIVPFARFSIFTIYFWFGILKVLGQSPATPLVDALFQQTVIKMMPGFGFSQFIFLFGLFEMLIGILFLIKRLDKFSICLLSFHLITTAMPLIFLPSYVWLKPFVPTLEGQYIIKNMAIIALALSIIHSRKQSLKNV